MHGRIHCILRLIELDESQLKAVYLELKEKGATDQLLNIIIRLAASSPK